MKNVIAGLIAVSGLAGVASAGASNFSFQVSTDGGATWGSSASTTPGSTVLVRLAVSTSDTVYGFAGATYNIQGDGLDASSTANIADAGYGRQSGYNFGAGTQKVFYSGTKFKIDASSDSGFPGSTTAGINSAQNTPLALGSTFNQGNPAVIYMFAMNVGAGQLADITITTTADQVKGGLVLWYGTNSSSKGDVQDTVGTISGATIHVPAPASLAMLGLGGLVAGRRRR